MQDLSRQVSIADRELLRGHVVNLRQGRFSTDGDFITTPQDVESIFSAALPRALAEARAAGRPLRVLFFAHGGLVDEAAGISSALLQLGFWKANHVYPIFFIWETGILEVLADILRKHLIGQRGLGDLLKDATARVLEGVARPGGLKVWGNMKLSAQAASAAGGGARTVADRAGRFVQDNAGAVEVHALGHSAGAIFHSFFLPALVHAGAPVTSLHLLAPAINVPTFNENLVPLAGGGIRSVTMLTMHREFERADTAGPYPKSLLYLVHHAFEDPDDMPILGLEECLDPDVRRFFTGTNEIVFSVTEASASRRAATRAVHHGDFDNDAPTMNTVCRRILDIPDATAISDFPVARTRAFDPLERLNQELEASRTATALASGRAADGGTTGFGASNARGGAASATAPAVLASSPNGGRRTALCIGIDAYPAPNALAGCVNDSREWEQLFLSMDFTVGALRDEAATRETILGSLAGHVARMKAGDVFLFQYAGHGTQFADDTGDEPDGKDEAFCPVDMMTAGFIRDDEVREILNRVPAGALAVGFIDCCHSGSIARMMRATRAVANESRIRAIRPTAEMIEIHRQTRRGGRARAAAAARRDITFAACRDDQVAFESAGHGDFTTRAVPIIKNRKNGLTNLAVQKLIQAEFGADARQNPALDCTPAAEGLPFLQP